MSLDKPIAGSCSDLRCDRGNSVREVSYCATCASCLCDKCWDLNPIHLTTNHEKLAYKEFIKCGRLKVILDPSRDPEVVESLHGDDTNSTWFGIDRYDDGRPFLQDFEIYSQIMGNLPESEQVKYPQLVSFVGQTGAGKSTVIKMLIDSAEQRTTIDEESSFPSPVAGTPADDLTPTSADVHLYCDPATHARDRPILYADCEGLNAGEKVPLGAHRKRLQRMDNSRKSGLRVRPLAWATSDETKTRQYAVTQLYPRLLYTFSDVVVFVLKEPKTFDTSVLPYLLEWASALLKASTNQGTLPHAVIALNQCNLGINPDLWDVRKATEDLLRKSNHVLEYANGHHKLIKMAEKWRQRGRRIMSIRELIHCYYSSFTVVRIPVGHSVVQLSKQVSKLHRTISDLCDASYRSKYQARLLSSADDFGFHVQQAFTHFAEHLDQPFDFKRSSLKRNPIPEDLGDHVLRMAVAIQDKFPYETGQWIFEKLSRMVASCFLYDCVTYRSGPPQDLFGDYQHYFEKALTKFCDEYWPCEFSTKKGRCVNYRNRHVKEHQNAKGKNIGSGPYRSNFTERQNMLLWMNALKSKLAELQDDLTRLEDAMGKLKDPREPIRRLHLDNISRFFSDLGFEAGSTSGAAEFRSHVTCLCCLMRVPEYALRCGHALCSECIETFGDSKNTTIEFGSCPLHPYETSWTPPWKIKKKPNFAGVRILTLDGGGIRGIAELEVLAQLQRILRVDIPIAAFFDFIVGTSTGGIIALALGVKQWPIERCITEFKRLCSKAFTPREFHGVPVFQHLTTARQGSKWETTSLHEVLQQSLGDHLLFGGAQDFDSSYSARVAVTSTNEAATKGIVIANYCRRSAKHNYQFLRPDHPDDEMRTWEAAAATSAAPPFFKPFIHNGTNLTYRDGAFFNNNPVKVANSETKLLWPDTEGKLPDLLLSIGTSQHRTQVQKQIKTEIRERQTKGITKSQALKSSKSRKWKEMLHLGKAAKNRLGNVIDCERQWQDFIEAVPSRDQAQSRFRYVRINPDIGREPPSLDAKNEVEKLHRDVSSVYMTIPQKLPLEQVVFRLIASSFYFDKGHVRKSRMEGTAEVSGKLQCRFEESSVWLRQLGLWFESQQRPDFQPSFIISTGIQKQSQLKVELTENIIKRMNSHGEFRMAEIPIPVSTTESEVDIQLYLQSMSGRPDVYSISGFPRDFLEENHVKVADLKERDEDSKTSESSLDLNRAGSRRQLRTTLSAVSNPETGVESNTGIFHLRTKSEKDLSEPPHLAEENRRKSDGSVAKTRTEKLRLKHNFSIKSLSSHGSRSMLRSPASSLQDDDGQPYPESPEDFEKFDDPPSVFVTPPPASTAYRPPPRHSYPPNLGTSSTSTVASSSSHPPPSYTPSYTTTAVATRDSANATPRSSLSISRTPNEITDEEFEREIEIAKQESLRESREKQEQDDYELAVRLSMRDD